MDLKPKSTLVLPRFLQTDRKLKFTPPKHMTGGDEYEVVMTEPTIDEMTAYIIETGLGEKRLGDIAKDMVEERLVSIGEFTRDDIDLDGMTTMLYSFLISWAVRYLLGGEGLGEDSTSPLWGISETEQS